MERLIPPLLAIAFALAAAAAFGPVAGLLTGVVVALLGFGYQLAQEVLWSETDHAFECLVEAAEDGSLDVTLRGFAAFGAHPEQGEPLARLPRGVTVRVHLAELDYADQAAMDALEAAEREVVEGGGAFLVERSHGLGPEDPDSTAAELARRIGSMRRVAEVTEHLVWGGSEATDRSRLGLEAGRIHLDLAGSDLEGALEVLAADLAEGLGPVGEQACQVLLERGAAEALDLGHGVLLIHASLPGVGGLRLAAGRLTTPIRLASGQGDLLFVMLDDEADAEGHLMALGCLAYTCTSTQRLEALRAAATPAGFASIVEDGAREAEALRKNRGHALGGDDQLVVIELPSGEPSGPLLEALGRVFAGTVRCRPGEDATHPLLAATSGADPEAELILAQVPTGKLPTLEAVLVDFARGEHGPVPTWRSMRAVPRSKALRAANG